MEKRAALKAIMWISVLGILFSGYLSYTEIFKQVCGLSALGLGTCGAKVFEIPACVYGFVMYLIVFVISVIGLKRKD